MTFLAQGCVSPQQPKPQMPVAVSAPKREDTQALQEQARLLELQKGIMGWQERLNVLIDTLQFRIAEDKASTRKDPAAKERGLKQQGDLLRELKELRVLQRNLYEPDSALSREKIYFGLIDGYLASLRLSQEWGEKGRSPSSGAQEPIEQIKRKYENKDFDGVIDLYRKLGEDQVNAMSRAYYALSLVSGNRNDEATTFVDQMLAKGLPASCEDAILWYEVGERLATAGNTDRAEKVFGALIRYYQTEEEWRNKSKTKMALLGTGREGAGRKDKINEAVALYDQGKVNFSIVYLLCLEAKKSCADFACQEEIQNLLSQFTDKAVNGIDEKLGEVDKNMEEFRFPEAEQIISSLRDSFPGEEYPSPIAEKLALVRDKENALQERIRGRQDEMAQQKIDEASQLTESEKYKEAIAGYDKLQETPYRSEAEQKKQVAIDGLARKNRLKAGQLFLQAKNCTDLELKKTYLVQSYTLLKEVMDNYPNNTYAEKIKKNLEDVRTELIKIDPEYFSGKEDSTGATPEPSETEN